MGDILHDLKLGVDLGGATVAKFNEVSERIGSPVRLAAAPEAQEQGEVVVTWTPDRQRIAAVTRQDSEGRILSVIAEAPEARSEADK